MVPAPCSLFEGLLDPAILEGVIGEDHESPTRGEHGIEVLEELLESGQLAVDGDAQPLKGPGRRIEAASGAARQRGANDPGELTGGVDGTLSSRLGDGVGHARRMSFLTVLTNDPGQLRDTPLVHQLPR